MPQPYHHGALREALLEEGQSLLVNEGPQAVSLRALARRIGVSHSAPERHFATRQELLDALAVSGFSQLSAALRQALADHPGDLEGQYRAAARAYVSFAQENGPLLDLMWAPRPRRPEDPITAAASELIGLTAALVAEAAEDNPMGHVSPLRALTVATLQGLATLAATHRLSRQEVDAAIEEAVTVFTPVVAHRTSGAKR